MPSFDNSPFASLNGTLLVAGIPSYGWGSLNTLAQPTRFVVTSAVSLGGTAVLTGVITGGNIPLVGDFITTRVDNANFAVTNKAISAVSIDASTGVGTISYLNASNVPATAVTGIALVPIAEQPENFVNGASTAFCFQQNDPNMANARSIRLIVSLPVLPSTGTITLQAAINRTDSEFKDLVQVGTMTGGVFVAGDLIVTSQPGRWYRFNNTGVSQLPATTAKVIAKMLV